MLKLDMAALANAIREMPSTEQETMKFIDSAYLIEHVLLPLFNDRKVRLSMLDFDAFDARAVEELQENFEDSNAYLYLLPVMVMLTWITAARPDELHTAAFV